MSNSDVLQKEARKELAKRTLARRNLHDFAKYTYEDYIDGWHNRVLCDALDRVLSGEIRFLMVEAPPRHSKSVHVSQIFPGFAVGKNPDDSVIVSSYSGDLAVKHGRETRNLLKTAAYQLLFKTRLAFDSKAKGSWNTQKIDEKTGEYVPAKGAYNAVGIGGSTTGKGAKFGIVDDSLKDRKEAESLLIRDNVWDWFRSVFRTRLTPDGRMVVMGTRWHLDDLQGRIMEHETWIDYFEYLKTGHNGCKWVRLSLMAIAETDQLPYRKAGEALWPERYSLEELESIKESLGPYEFEALYQQRPISSETQEFKPTWRKYRTHTEAAELKRRNRYLTIDSAASKNAGADFTGLCDNLVDTDNFWNLRAWKQKIASDELIELLFSLHLANKYDKIGIEEGMYMLTIKPFLDKAMRERNIYLPIEPLKHRSTQKEVRIRGLIPYYSAGTIYHIEGECDELEYEQSVFPNGKHDDVVDATAYQTQLVGTGGSTLIA